MWNVGPYPVKEAVLIGRFQPFTKGHLRAYQEAKKHFPIVNIALVVRDSGRLDQDNPLTPEQRERLIKKAIPGVNVYRVRNLYWEHVFEDIGHPVVLVVGQDREKALQAQGGAKDGSGLFRYFVIPRTDEDISATKVRNAIRNGDFETFKSLMPQQLWSEWYFLRDVIVDTIY